MNGCLIPKINFYLGFTNYSSIKIHSFISYTIDDSLTHLFTTALKIYRKNAYKFYSIPSSRAHLLHFKTLLIVVLLGFFIIQKYYFI